MRCHVRHATEKDIPRIVDLAEKFWASSGYDRQGPFNAADAEAAADLMLKNGIALVAETPERVVGMVMLVIGPGLCNHDVRIAHEVAWFVDPEATHTGAGIMLLRAIEPAARARHCRMIQMHLLTNSPPQGEILYRRLGFSQTERSFTKFLED